MVKFFKNGDRISILTDAEDEGMFIDQVSRVLDAMIEGDVHKYDWAFQFNYWIPAITDICCRYRGYKNGVIEQKLYCSSSHGRLPDPREAEGSYEDGEINVRGPSIIPEEENIEDINNASK